MRTVLRCVLVVVAVGLPGALSAEVKIVQRADGSTYVYNVPDRRVARRVQAPATRSDDVAAQGLDEIVALNASRTSLEPDLVKAVIQVESSFNSRARSPKGAMGLMQIMPGTAGMYSISDPYDPAQNIGVGTKYLRRMLDTFGSLELALAAYNAGPAAVKRFGGVPPYPETRAYIEKVMRLYRNNDTYSLAGSGHLRRGRKTYLRRDAKGHLIMTTSPHGG